MNICARMLSLEASMLFAIAIGAGIASAVETPSAADVQRHHAAINQALTTAAPFKAAVENYRRHHDDFPTSNLDAGLQPPDMYRNPDVRQVAINPKGVIDVMLTASSGVDGGTIVLTPSMPKNSDDLAVEWKCTTPNYSDVSDATAGLCEYTKVP